MRAHMKIRLSREVPDVQVFKGSRLIPLQNPFA